MHTKLILQAIFLGILQGVTEFLPVSSSGHLVIAQHFCPEIARFPVSLDATLHLGTFLALCVYFWKDLIEMLFHPRLAIPILIATFVTAGAVLPFKKVIESFFSSPQLACFMLFVTGILLFIATKKKGNNRTQVGVLDAIKIGLAQAVAVIPGISRSGTTIVAGILFGLKAEIAVRFSFLIAIPAILGAAVLELYDLHSFPSLLLLSYFLGFLVSFCSGLWAIKCLLRLLTSTQNALKYFAYYCWLAGIIFFILLRFV
jgi:undecaprenyl-diphosphatase